MSKAKGKKAPAVEPLPVRFIEQDFLSASSTGTLCRDILARIASDATDIVQRKENEKLALARLPAQILQHVLSALEWSNQCIDPIETVSEGPGHAWEAEPEPARCPVDRWARGAIPVKARKERPGSRKLEVPSSAHGPHSLAPSRSYAKSIRSVKSRRSVNDPSIEPKIPEEGPSTRPKPFEPRLRPQTADRKHEKLRKRELQKIEQARKEKLALKRQQDAEVQSEKGGDTPGRHQNVTYDHTGKAIPVEAIKASTLPAYRSSPRVKLPTASGEPSSTNTTARKKKPKSKLVPSSTKEVLSALSTGKEQASVAPQLPADAIEPSLGVTLRNSKGQVKSNKKAGKQAKNMSRAQYNSMVDSMSPPQKPKQETKRNDAHPEPAVNGATPAAAAPVPTRKPRKPVEHKHNSLSKPIPPATPPEQSKSPRQFKSRKPVASAARPKLKVNVEVKEQADQRHGKTSAHSESLARSLGGTMKPSYLYQPPSPRRSKPFSPMHKAKVEVSEKAAQFI